MDNTTAISTWIEEQLKAGRTDDEIIKTIFVDEDDYYILKKTRKPGQFDLRCQFFGVINLRELEGIQKEGDNL